MLAQQLITNTYPTVEPDDKVSFALQLIGDFDILHIALVDDLKYIGLISKDDLLDVDEDASLKVLYNDLFLKSVKASDHFSAALRLASQNNLSIVPVVNAEMEWVGAITCNELLRAATTFTGSEEPGAIIVLEMERKSYSFGEISKLVETNDAYITQFNTTTEAETGLLIVTIKINKLEISDIISTFNRYEYSIRYFVGEEHYENEIRYNYDNLMTYLKV